jgi:hypothetical protein
MKVIVLTAAQQAEAKTLATAVSTASTALQTARKALHTYLQTISKGRLSLTDDGTSVVIQ